MATSTRGKATTLKETMTKTQLLASLPAQRSRATTPLPRRETARRSVAATASPRRRRCKLNVCFQRVNGRADVVRGGSEWDNVRQGEIQSETRRDESEMKVRQTEMKVRQAETR